MATAPRKPEPPEPVRFDVSITLAPVLHEQRPDDSPVTVTFRMAPEVLALAETLRDGLAGMAAQVGATLEALLAMLAQWLTGQRAPLALPPPTDAGPRLTRREIEVVALVAQRLRPDEICEQLCISSNTLKTHRMHIRRKIGNHGEVLAWWERNRHRCER